MKSIRSAVLGSFIIAALNALCLPASASAADDTHETRALSASFDRLHINGSVDVHLVQGPVAGVTVDAPAKVAAGIRTSVEDGVLVIESGHGTMFEFSTAWHAQPSVTVTTPMLHEIVMNGSADLTAANFSSSDDLTLRLLSSGDLRIDHLSVKKLETVIQGSADVRLAGEAAEQSVKIQGSGDYHAETLKSGSASIAIQGSGDVSVWAVDALAVSIAGGGDVEYWGTPKVSQSIAGSGDVTSRGARS